MEKLIGIGIVSLATILYASLYPLIKLSNRTFPPFTVMAISMFVLFILSFLASIIFEHSLNLKWTASKETIGILVLAGVINFAGFWLVIQGYRYMPLWQQTMFGLFTPILAGIMAYFLLGEKLNNNLIIGLSIMAIGLYVAVR
jgi:drug/metabolite transporter (DMT)-like permease